MRRGLYILILMLCVGEICVAEEKKDLKADLKLDEKHKKNHLFLRSFNSSLLLKYSKDEKQIFFLDDYGSVNKLEVSKKDVCHNYMYQGQEFDPELNLYFYPSRVYSPSLKSFSTPDPKSQFYSPYLFVGSDPVNNIDKDGNVSKPLFLYGTEDGKPIDRIIVENMSEMHYYPLKDFLDDKVGELEDWDGNVYVDAHMLDKETDNILVDKFKRKVKTRDVVMKDGKLQKGAERTAELNAYEYRYESGRALGKRLKEFSMDNEVPLKNVVLGGCQGETAAESVVEGFEATPATEFAGDEVSFFGTKRGYVVLPSGTEHGEKGLRLNWAKLKYENKLKPMKLRRGERMVNSYGADVGDSKLLPGVVSGEDGAFENMLLQGRMSRTTEEFMSHLFADY